MALYIGNTPAPAASATVAATPEEKPAMTDAPDKVPVTTLADAAAAFNEFTRLMNVVATEQSLCSVYDKVVTKVQRDLPATSFEDVDYSKWYLSYAINGRVFAPASFNDSRDEVYVAASIETEYRTWAGEHNLDQARAGTWLAWVDSLPAHRGSANTRTIDRYANTRETPRRQLMLNVAAEPEQTEPLPSLDAEFAISA